MYVQKTVDSVLLDLQSEDPKVHVMKRKLLGLIHDLQVKFCKPSALNMKSVLQVQYSLSHNQNEKADKDLLTGTELTSLLSDIQ